MFVTVEFTHHEGRLLKPGSRERRAPLKGELITVLQHSKTGSYSVARILGENSVSEPRAELHDVKLYCIAHHAFQLRGLELVGDGAYALQGWLVTVGGR